MCGDERVVIREITNPEKRPPTPSRAIWHDEFPAAARMKKKQFVLAVKHEKWINDDEFL